ncbi:uncharacterized protein [Henckelia pumila]|uniref:uncharacterized protein n=1 Tax=Henckelia pumila TaxID=405737 RepID=UPI003C6E7D83
MSPSSTYKMQRRCSAIQQPPRMCYGCIIRDHRGIVVGAIHGCIPGIQNPAIAEALGIREALNWLKELDYHHFQIESDAKIVIDALNSSVSDQSSLGLLIEYCKLLIEDFQSCLFYFNRRSANQVAHALARAVGSLSDFEGRVTPSPSFISDVLLIDSI